MEQAINFIHDVGSRFASADSFHDVLNEIVDFVTDLVRCDSCFIYVSEGEELVLRASKNPHPEILDALKMPVGQGITGWVAEHKEIVALEKNASNDPRFRLFSELPEDAYESFLSVAVIFRGRVISVINVQHKDPYNFSPQEIKIISTIGHLVGAAIENARLEDEVNLLSEKLAVRKILERAKGIVQREFGVSEEQAYGILRTQARQRRKSMKEIADAILLSDELKRTAKPPVPTPN